MWYCTVVFLITWYTVLRDNLLFNTYTTISISAGSVWQKRRKKITSKFHLLLNTYSIFLFLTQSSYAPSTRF
jgi:hypothetical protein